MTFQSASETVAFDSPYIASICHSAADKWEAGICCVHVDEKTEERQTMEGTAGADGTDVVSTKEGGRRRGGGEQRASIILLCNTLVYMLNCMQCYDRVSIAHRAFN